MTWSSRGDGGGRPRGRLNASTPSTHPAPLLQRPQHTHAESITRAGRSRMVSRAAAMPMMMRLASIHALTSPWDLPPTMRRLMLSLLGRVGDKGRGGTWTWARWPQGAGREGKGGWGVLRGWGSRGHAGGGLRGAGREPPAPAAPPPAPPAGRRGVADCSTGSRDPRRGWGGGGGALGPSGTLGAALWALCGGFRASGVLGPSPPPRHLRAGGAPAGPLRSERPGEGLTRASSRRAAEPQGAGGGQRRGG